jgi:hypothetical protein
MAGVVGGRAAAPQDCIGEDELQPSRHRKNVIELGARAGARLHQFIGGTGSAGFGYNSGRPHPAVRLAPC